MTRPDHAYDGVIPGALGYAPVCVCGWIGREYPTRRSAQGAAAAHVRHAQPQPPKEPLP